MERRFILNLARANPTLTNSQPLGHEYFYSCTEQTRIRRKRDLSDSMSGGSWSRQEGLIYKDKREDEDIASSIAIADNTVAQPPFTVGALQQPFLLQPKSTTSNHNHDDPEDPQHPNDDQKTSDDNAWVAGRYAKSIVYAGLDAIVTTFSLVSSISGGHMSSMSVLVLGFANLVADGFSMAFSDVLSSTTERDVADLQKRKIQSHVDSKSPSEKATELISAYEALGMQRSDAQTVVDVFSKYRNVMAMAFACHVNNGEDKKAEEEEEESPWRSGVVTFMSFVAFGCVPLVSYLVLIPLTKSASVKFGGACVLSGVALMALGMAKASMSKKKYISSVAMALVNGGLAALAAYFVGWLLRDVAGLQD